MATAMAAHCAGTIGAPINGVGVVGVAPEASLYAVKVLSNAGSGQWSWLIAGLNWCIQNKMRIASMSLGGGGAPTALETMCNTAFGAGVLLVAAAGNSGPGMGTVGFPGKYKNVIAVSAIDSSNVIASFSSRGPEVEICAPGVKVLSTVPGGGYGNKSGTSMACPHVSGAAAVVWARTASQTTSKSGTCWAAPLTTSGLPAGIQSMAMVASTWTRRRRLWCHLPPCRSGSAQSGDVVEHRGLKTSGPPLSCVPKWTFRSCRLCQMPFCRCLRGLRRASVFPPATACRSNAYRSRRRLHWVYLCARRSILACASLEMYQRGRMHSVLPWNTAGGDDYRIFYVRDNPACRFVRNAFALEPIPFLDPNGRQSTMRSVQPGISFFDRPDQQSLFKLHLPYVLHTPRAVDSLFTAAINRDGSLTVLAGLVETDWYAHPVNLIIRKPGLGGLDIAAGDIVAQVIFIPRQGRSGDVHVVQPNSHHMHALRCDLLKWYVNHAQDRSAYKRLARSHPGRIKNHRED